MTVEVEVRGRVLIATISREVKRNALNPDITGPLDAAMNQLEDDPEIWCGILTGGGLGLVLCCDLVVASNTAYFGLPEVKRGLMPDFGGAFRIRDVLPLNVAREMLLTGEKLPAERAERLGFVNLLTEPGEALGGALSLAERINANAPLAVRESMGMVNHGKLDHDEDAWARSDAAHARLGQTEDVKEGLSAFFERREPRWTGR